MLDGSRFGNLYYEKFDKVLVDAPCSSIGALHKVKEVLSWWNDREVNWFVNIQRRLLISAIKAVKPGGIIVYSTCTLTVEENELLINDIVEKYPIEVQKIEPLNINEEPGISEYHDKKLSPDIEKTIRIWPHKSFMEGFFIAKLLKTDKIKEQKPRHKKQKEYRKLLSINDGEIRKIVGFLEKEFGIEKDFFKDKLFKISKGVWLCSKEMEKFPVQESFREGLRLVRIHKQGIKLTTNAAQLVFPYIKRGVLNIDSEEKVLKILKGEEVEINERGEGTRVIVYDGICLGMGVLRNKKLKSQIPMSRRFKEIIV
jgi:16S rRNA (cytosine1407-C5)-methyltransferase